MRPDHLLSCARRKLNRPDAVIRRWECIPFDGPTTHIRVTLADGDLYSNPQDVDVTLEEQRTEEARFEAETGKCHVCGGDGQEWRGWSRDSGHRYRTCKRCAGTGEAPK